MNEDWKWIENYENLYSISNYGNVFSFISNKYKEPVMSKQGYLWVMLHGNNKPLKKFIHTLVLENFIGPRPIDAVARHYPDQNKTNNNLDNLSWNTAAQNARDRYEMFHENTKLNEELVIEIKNKLLYQNYTQADITREYEIYPETVSKIVYNKHWKDIGPDISEINFDKRRILTELEVSQIKRAILININSKTIINHFKISFGVLSHIKNNLSFQNIEPCNLKDFPNITKKTHGLSKLSVDDVIEIRKLLKQGNTQSSVAEKYGVDSKTIYSIKINKAHIGI
jgi:predicted XRE-type DNA-binding protein